MSDEKIGPRKVSQIWSTFSPAALDELAKLGFESADTPHSSLSKGLQRIETRPQIKKAPIHAPQVINEAHGYEAPSSFSRGMRVELPGATMLFLSGTASVDEEGQAAHEGDFNAQCFRTYRNLTNLLEAEGASWHDVVRTTCYLRDIERDYKAFNEIRTFFFRRIGLNPLPASTGIQARLCWSELLIEMELIAVLPNA